MLQGTYQYRFFHVTCDLHVTVAAVVHLAFTLARSWTALRRAGLSAGIDLQLTVRVVVFTAYILCAIG